ncbi:MAG: competence protein CoiA family protein [Rhodoferax sp.]|nr:competence protein CoiA family protein [Rhodoferax sp.]
MSSLFGLNEFNHLVHVGEVDRGLACQCRCVVCEEPLVARQGSVREHHFAHASNREPCDSSHESLLHRYAKQLIVEARGLVAPMTPVVAHFLGINDQQPVELLQSLTSVQEEVTIGSIRPDLLVVTPDGVEVAIEIAYSSFCDLIKVAEFQRLNLPALEIDLSRFTPDNFDPAEVKKAVIRSVAEKNWVWPTELPPVTDTSLAPDMPPPPTVKKYLPEEIINFSGRWVSVKQFPSGDIAVRVVAYDPDLVSLVRSVAKTHGGRYNPQYKTWNVPRWSARLVRRHLSDHAQGLEISMEKAPLKMP